MEVAAPPAAASAYDALRALIIRGALAPGTRLIELELSTRLGVSRTPVREALRRLVSEGYVRDPSGGRYAKLSVAPLTAEDARALFQIVGALEGVAAREAAALATTPRAALAERLKQANRELKRAAESADPDHDAIVRLDEAFHQGYVDAGGARLRALHAVVKPQAERYERWYVSLLTGAIGESVEEHKVIVRAIRDGDADQAERAVETNWRNAGERLANVVRRAGARGEW